MAEQNEELKMINHLLEVEKDANSLISEAMETSEKKISEARAKYNAEYKEKTEKIIEEYPDFAVKYALLNEAGLTHRQVLERLGAEYKNSKKSVNAVASKIA